MVKNNPEELGMGKKEKITISLEKKKNMIDLYLNKLITSNQGVPIICEAMEYSLRAGGKRLRPLLCLSAAEIFGCRSEDIIEVACSLELVHTYSLIHDDLPAMDDDDFRRNKPTSHKVFGEAMAILAGDALLTLAFEILAGYGFRKDKSFEAVQMINELAVASGYRGMIGGQVLDLEAEGKNITPAEIEEISGYKTAALIKASIIMGAIAGKAVPEKMQSLKSFASNAGLAFQIADDLLNFCGDAAEMGKNTGTDRVKEKATYPLLKGEMATRKRMEDLYFKALNELKVFGDEADILRYLASILVFRDK